MKFLLLITFFFTLTPPLPAYFDIQLDRIEVIKQNPEILIFNLKIRKTNKVRSIIGNITIQVPADNLVACETKVLKKQGNEYRYTPFRKTKTPFCDAIHEASSKDIL